jgi:hypothetical protein
MKGSDECSACFNDTFVNLMSGDSDSMPSMDECYGSGRSCEIGMCLNTPQEGETICASCWNKHDSADTPGFPSEYEGDDQLGGCGTCNAPTNDWFCKSCYKTQDVICNRIAQEEELTQCTDSCKEMGMMSEGCEFCK